MNWPVEASFHGQICKRWHIGVAMYCHAWSRNKDRIMTIFVQLSFLSMCNPNTVSGITCEGMEIFASPNLFPSSSIFTSCGQGVLYANDGLKTRFGTPQGFLPSQGLQRELLWYLLGHGAETWQETRPHPQNRDLVCFQNFPFCCYPIPRPWRGACFAG